jgi:hypothetical protein
MLTFLLPLPTCSTMQDNDLEFSADRKGINALINDPSAVPVTLSVKYLEMCTDNFTSKLLGEGAFGKVYLGYDKELGMKIAVKRIALQIPNQDALDEITLSFKREIAVSSIRKNKHYSLTTLANSDVSSDFIGFETFSTSKYCSYVWV